MKKCGYALKLVILLGMLSQQSFSQIFTDWGDLVDAISSAQPGDVFTIADGEHTLSDALTFSSTNSGLENNWITVKAQTTGGVKLVGESTVISCKPGSHHIHIEGFIIETADETAIKLDGAQYVRITQNEFRLGESDSFDWIVIGGVANGYHRIDHNLFENKVLAGNFIALGGTWEEPWEISRDIILHKMGL